MKEYLAQVERALYQNRKSYFPMNKKDRERQNLKLGREIGYGLGNQWKKWASSLYGRLIVRNSLDSIGVVIDNKQWIKAIMAGAATHRVF